MKSVSTKRKREPSATCFDPRQLDLVELIKIDQTRRRAAFAILDREIDRLLDAKTS
jgi:hypothetical protein